MSVLSAHQIGGASTKPVTPPRGSTAQEQLTAIVPLLITVAPSYGNLLDCFVDEHAAV